jgi:predicted dithiol-disulfide oxidoreductase (DUF899 family)
MSDTTPALDEAFERMAVASFELPNGFVNHGAMACEALVVLDCTDDIGSWARRFAGAGASVDPVVPAGFEWRQALGDYHRLPEWIGYSRRGIRAPAMTFPPSGGLIGHAVASKDPARWPESSCLIGGPEMPEHRIGTREEWQAARNELAELEAEQAERDEEIKRKRRELPWVPVEKEYAFDTEDGKKQLAELFEGRSQLLAYNIMFGPDFEIGACPGCTNLADGFEGLLLHMNKRDVTLICFSRAPIDRLVAYKQRMGWQFPYVSTYSTDFPFDFGLALTEEQAEQIPELQEMAQNPPGWLQFWASQVGAQLKDGLRENPGYIAFARENGTVYHTYTVTAPDPFVAPYFSFLLDRTPKPQPDEPLNYRKDEYPD